MKKNTKKTQSFAERKKGVSERISETFDFSKKNPHIICSVCACLICPQLCVYFKKEDIRTELLR